MSLDEPLPGWRPRQLASEGPRYLALVNALERDIVDGRLSDGDRLPAHRDLARELSLSVGTVSKAYREAEHRGMVRAHVGQGTFIQRRSVARTRATTAYEPVNMALNVPVNGNETQILSALFGEMGGKRDLAPLLDYQPHGGNRRHREIIAASLCSGPFAVDPARLFLCNGAQHAIDIAVRLVARPGDAILVDTVTYSGFKAIAAANNLVLIPVAMDGEGTDPDALETASRTYGAKVFYCMPPLQNPTGRTMGLTRRRRIAEVTDNLHLMVIEDDVHGFFLPDRPLPLTELIPDRSFYITSYSKRVAPGFRVGMLVVPPVLIEQTELLLHASCWYLPPMLSEMAVRLIESRKLDDLVHVRRQQAIERYRVFSDVFPAAEKLKFPPFYGWLPLPSQWSASAFASAARRRGILVTPPNASMVDDAEPGAIRVCLGGPNGLPELSSALHTLHEIITRPPSNVFSVA
ncbi:PLP-dependent aminotransferase family protein [Bradyrhizobium sp. 197]|uniref:aminotransferase-like domain-containing protein n=1 Tax=Bradyrhizobium sp. 197 TaxID=2782663 RepID=UPI001FFAEE99|nr:PLP-dependent aminotransferase family protein [Bradyrhizobium sp. 197]MCK1480652.1 PLP-dependent aminotransferase family protein [Bradyrhizobium sp. 197]